MHWTTVSSFRQVENISTYLYMNKANKYSYLLAEGCSLSLYIYLNTWHLGVPKFSFKRVRVLEIHPTQPRGGHPSHSNLVRGKLTSPTPNPAGDGTSGLTSYPRRRSKVSEATCLRPQRSAPSRTWTWAVQPRVQRSDHWATHASPIWLCCVDFWLQFYIGVMQNLVVVVTVLLENFV